MKPDSKPRKFWTQCSQSAYGGCDQTTQLDKPGKWRCPKHVKAYGPLVPDPRPTVTIR